MFNEITLQEEIEKMWGAYGAHAEVYQELLKRAQKPTANIVKDVITPLVVRAVTTDGCHHKQWYLEAIAEALQIELPPHDLGMAP